MAAIVWQNVVDFDGALASVPADAQTSILGFVNSALNVAVLDGEDGFRTRLARIYLAGHFGVGAMPGSSGAAGGPVASESGGDGLSLSYAVVSAATSGAAYTETAWGRRYLELVRSSPLARVPLVL